MSFQTHIPSDWPTGTAGAFASANPCRSVPSPLAGGFRAGRQGVTIGAFAWIDPADPTGQTLTNSGTGAPAGFVLRSQQGLCTQYLQEATMTIPPGFGVTLAEGGDFFAQLPTAAIRGQNVLANTADGTPLASAPGSPAPEGAAATGWVVSQGAPAGSPCIITGPMQPVFSAPAQQG